MLLEMVSVEHRSSCSLCYRSKQAFKAWWIADKRLTTLRPVLASTHSVSHSTWNEGLQQVYVMSPPDC